MRTIRFIECEYVRDLYMYRIFDFFCSHIDKRPFVMEIS